jgi:glutamate synthase domain-containing protein 3
MVNPFREFHTIQGGRREIPLDRIIATKDLILDQLVAGYHKLIEEEVHNLVWLVDHGALPRAYAAAEKAIAEVNFTVEDVEDFCFTLEKADSFALALAGPSGLYLSAMCNRVEGTEISLRLKGLKSRVHLLGYRLPEGKRLVVEGSCGDFAGAAMEGGEIIVQGHTGNWTGVGLRWGKITVEGNAGERTGEWMEGGEVQVKGRIGSLGQVRNGKVYLGDLQVAPVRETT